MAGLFKGDSDDFVTASPKGLEPHQIKAAAAPDLPTTELAKQAPAPQPDGNFKDLESLLEQLGSPPVFELGNPLPKDKFLPKPRIGGCPASHNRALLDTAS